MPPKKALYIGMDVANFNTVVSYRWTGDAETTIVGSKDDDTSEHPFPSTVYAAYTTIEGDKGDNAAMQQNRDISGEKHDEGGVSIHVEGFKPLFHIKRSTDVPNAIRKYLKDSCNTTVENNPQRVASGGLLMRVHRGAMVTSVDPVLCMKAFLQFLQQKTVEKTRVDLSQEVEVFITASCPIDVPLKAAEELKEMIREVWTSGGLQKAKVTVQVTREPFSGALFVQDWVFNKHSTKLD